MDVTLITDGAAGSALAAGRIDAVIVGSDRIARNGDVCNKIGTYPLAVLARRHGVPLLRRGPSDDLRPRPGPPGPRCRSRTVPRTRLTAGLGSRGEAPGIPAENPAFDVTPAELVTAIVTDAGVVEAPDRARVEKLLRGAGRIAD